MNSAQKQICVNEFSSNIRIEQKYQKCTKYSLFLSLSLSLSGICQITDCQNLHGTVQDMKDYWRKNFIISAYNVIQGNYSDSLSDSNNLGIILKAQPRRLSRCVRRYFSH